MARNLRKRKPINYLETSEPAFDEYVYCEKCFDFVFEYCSLHGPLLVIPDNQVPSKSPFPSFVPRSALTIPNVFLHIAPSVIPGLGVFTTLTLPRGVRFGPYRGLRTNEVNSMYCWQIYDGNNKRSHVVDAADANKSNWMRFVNCARHWREQNLVAFQYQGELYYRTIKLIPRFTELLVFYGSEFANTLKIDLRRYNRMDHHVINGPEVKIKDERNKVNSKFQNRNDNVSEIIDDFQYIEEIDTNENQSYNYNEINNRKSPNVVQYNIDKQYFKDFEYINEQNDNFLGEIFHCDQCDFKSNHKKSLKRHFLTKHTVNPRVTCTICPYKTNIKDYFNRHMKTHREIKKYKCQRCKKIFLGKSLFDDHKVQCQYIEHKCCHCKYVTSRQFRMREHTLRHTKELTFQCDKCSYFGHVMSDLRRHKKTMHAYTM